MGAMEGLDLDRLSSALASLDELLDAAERGRATPSMAIAGLANLEPVLRATRLGTSVGLTNGTAPRPPEALEPDRGLINGFGRGGDRPPAGRARVVWGARARRTRRSREALERMAVERPPGVDATD
jgi:hypothetical protein